MIQITTTVVEKIDMSGLGFYANIDQPFDAADYCEFAGISLRDVDFASIQAANDKASQTGPGQFLKIDHE